MKSASTVMTLVFLAMSSTAVAGTITIDNNGNVYTDGSNWGLTSTSTASTALTEAWTEVAPNAFDMDFIAVFGDVPVELQTITVE